MPRHEGILFVLRFEDEVAFEAKAEFHASGMIVEVGPFADGEEVAVPKNGYAIDSIRSKVEDPIARSVAVGYSVSYHFARIVPNPLRALEYKKFSERIMPTYFG